MAQHLVVVVGLASRYDELGDGGGMVFSIPVGTTIPLRPGLSFQTKTDPLFSLLLFSIFSSSSVRIDFKLTTLDLLWKTLLTAHLI